MTITQLLVIDLVTEELYFNELSVHLGHYAEYQNYYALSNNTDVAVFSITEKVMLKLF